MMREITNIPKGDSPAEVAIRRNIIAILSLKEYINIRDSQDDGGHP